MRVQKFEKSITSHEKEILQFSEKRFGRIRGDQVGLENPKP
ncbi:hypothetical protein [Bartonella krasnovii]|nr:hypothetical protein [Bartonella krasnovii]